MPSCPLLAPFLMQFQANMNQFRELHWQKKNHCFIQGYYSPGISSPKWCYRWLTKVTCQGQRATSSQVGSKSAWANYQTLVQVSLFWVHRATTQTGQESSLDTSREHRTSKQWCGTQPSPGEGGRAKETCSVAHGWEQLWNNALSVAKEKALDTTAQKSDEKGNQALQMWPWGIFRDTQNRSRMKAERWRSTNFQEDGNSFYIKGS